MYRERAIKSTIKGTVRSFTIWTACMEKSTFNLKMNHNTATLPTPNND